ncbi:MAG: Eco57I restriction-modification methylase domain-containing protein [Janthinobacterium lividum]
MLTATDGLCVSLKPELTMKPELGQVFTPRPVAELMASMLQCRQPCLRLLDPGAGAGSLTLAAVEALCRRLPEERPERLQITAYEIDTDLIQDLSETLEICRLLCTNAQIEFAAEIITRDFLEAASEQLSTGLFAETEIQKFNCVILNPPYRKIHAHSKSRLWLRRVGIETTNLYTGFLATAIRLLDTEGEIVAITPRSFCNGPYFQSFRRDLLSTIALDRLHLFESRQETFREADVLQETIIFHAVKNALPPVSVYVSGSAASAGAEVFGRHVPFSEVVSPDDPNAFIRIVPEAEALSAARRIGELPCRLDDLGLSVSTGRVVDFRARAFLRAEPEAGTVPLLYPGHLSAGRVIWPLGKDSRQSAKPGNLLVTKETEMLLVPNANYVLMRRFSTKEEKKRLVATVFEAGCVPGEWVGFENHLNYFHCHGSGMNLDMARGLGAFLNSTLADSYFRQFNGHTQVNATDLRSFRYPSISQLQALGRHVGDSEWKQQEIDDMLENELNAETD